jgi:rhomboid protease GluP
MSKKQKIHQDKFQPHNCYGTYILLITNLIVFILEIKLGGSQNINTLYRLGALTPNDIFIGEWWRAISANFLHYGWLHLISNLLGLYAIGRIIELRLGIIPYLIAYFCSGIGSMLGFTFLALKLGETDQIAMGASGAIMGLIGILCAILLRGWQLEKTRQAGRRFSLVISIVALQSIFDIITPQVSFIIHFFGLILGFCLGLLFIFICQK